MVASGLTSKPDGDNVSVCFVYIKKMFKLTKEQLLDLAEEFNRNLYNYRNEPKKPAQILWERYNQVLRLSKASQKG